MTESSSPSERFMKSITAIVEAANPASDEVRDIMIDNVSFVFERARLCVEILRGIPEPLPPLSNDDVAAILQVGKDHDWDKRGPDMRNPVQWVLDYYSSWIPGLLTSHIKQADPKLYFSFMKRVGRQGLPDGIYIPTHNKNEVRKEARQRIIHEYLDLYDSSVLSEELPLGKSASLSDLKQ